jgi:hypothetical protein
MRTLLYITRVEKVSSTETLIGRAAAGSSESDAVWRIMKIVDDGVGNLQTYWRDSNPTAFNSSWTDRASYTYS